MPSIPMLSALIDLDRGTLGRTVLRRFERYRDDLYWRVRLEIEERAQSREPRLFNAAHRRPAQQSSTKGPSSEYGAQRGTDGLVGGPGFLSTKREDRPWWMVELQACWPIHSIRIHSPRDPAAAKATELQVSISADGQQWNVVHSGAHRFGEAASAAPLVIRLRAKQAARFVKLELLRRGKLAFNQVEVMVAETHNDLWRVSRRHGFVFNFMTSLKMRRHVKPYSVRDVPRSGRIEAFHIDVTQGRFGNHLKQVGTAVCLARILGISRIYLMKLPMSQFDRPLRLGGVTVLPDTALERDRPKGVLSGSFFYKQPLGGAARGLAFRDIAKASRAVGQAIFGQLAAPPLIVPAETDLAIHMRAGDIFSRPDPHTRYVQPPLAFYQFCVAFAREHLGTKRVILVYEDEGNPCVGALMAWLDMTGFPYVAQSRTLEEDLAVLLAAKHCVFGRGSFGPAVAILSDNMRTVLHSWLEPDFADMPQVSGVSNILVNDAAGRYIRIGEWRNTPEQKQTMLDYPIESLRLAAD